MHFLQTADTRCLRNVPFIIFVKGTAVMPPYVILRLAEVSIRFFTSFRMTGDLTQNDERGATDPTLTRRRVLNAHSGYLLFSGRVYRKQKGFP